MTRVLTDVEGPLQKAVSASMDALEKSQARLDEIAENTRADKKPERVVMRGEVE